MLPHLSNIRPAVAVVTYQQAKEQLRITDDDERTYLLDAIDAATEYAETALDASLVQRTIVATFGHPDPAPYAQWGGAFYPSGVWPTADANRLPLPRGPVASVTSVADARGPLAGCRLESSGNTDWLFVPSGFVPPLVATYVAGFGPDLASVPADVRMAIRSHVASLWRHRESVTTDRLSDAPHNTTLFYARRRRGSVVG